jgi:hypothetical protein
VIATLVSIRDAMGLVNERRATGQSFRFQNSITAATSAANPAASVSAIQKAVCIFRSVFQLREFGGVQCVLCTGAPSQERGEVTDRFCSIRLPQDNHSENKTMVRTEMSGQSPGSTARESNSLISPGSLGRQKRNFISRILFGSTLERVGAGLRATTSRPQKPSASSFAKSCGVTTSATRPRRRPF